MSATTDKKLFTVLGTVREVEGKKRFVPSSPEFFRTMLSKVPVDKKVSCTFSAKIPTRSESQLHYHWVLMGFISEHTGFTKEECHDWIMIDKFGTKKMKIGNTIHDVRRSIADKALFPKYDMVELIERDLEICRELEIHVPTPQELGYGPTWKNKINK